MEALGVMSAERSFFEACLHAASTWRLPTSHLRSRPTKPMAGAGQLISEDIRLLGFCIPVDTFAAAGTCFEVTLPLAVLRYVVAKEGNKDSSPVERGDLLGRVPAGPSRQVRPRSRIKVGPLALSQSEGGWERSPGHGLKP